MTDNFALDNRKNAKSNMFLQRLLAASGFYTKKIDGIWGPGSETAYNLFLVKTKEISDKYGMFDKVSEKCIATLLPIAQEQARIFLSKANDTGSDVIVRIICGTRTYQEQDSIYAYGRTKNGKIVTNAKGGFSWHNFGVAWDIGVFQGNSYLVNQKPYKNIGQIGVNIGLDWGGTWKSIVDLPHYQVNLGKTISEVRILFEAGKPII